MRSIHAALGNYQCIIDDLIATEERAAARMRFTGVHRGAFFTIAAGRIADIWVLGDLDAVKQQLGVAGTASF